jgi:hypothetical protein
MQKKTYKSERGQAIILIAFSIMGLIGMTALTIDGGMAFSDHRHAQNAADTAALAGAYATVRDLDMKAAALNLASLNGYTDTDPSTASSSSNVNVEVYTCAESASSCGSFYAGNDEYIQVLITSTINTFFGRVIGVSHVTNRVNSIAHAEPGSPDPAHFGNALESLMPGCKGDGWNQDPFTITGGGTTTVTGSGIKINSTCDGALTQTGSTSSLTAPSICVGGTSTIHSGVFPAPEDNCGSPTPARIWPTPSCDTNGNGAQDAGEMGRITEVAGLVYESEPGYYNGDFPSGISSGQLFMKTGIYCIAGNFDVNSTTNVSTDYNQNGVHDYQSEGVLIYVTNDGVTMNGSALMWLHSINDPNQDPSIQGLLIFLPPTNCSTVNINGNSGSVFTGSIWAPCSLVTVSGSGGTGTIVNSQIIGYSVKVSGSGNLTVHYDKDQNAVSMSPASIGITK